MSGTPRVEGVTITALREIGDHRGAVLHMLRCDEAGYGGFGECYFSEVLPGVVKAWKRHRVQVQNVAVPVGRVRLVIYDGRDSSATRGTVDVLELGRPDAYWRVRIPPGLWYGFACISPTPALLANCADRPHDPEEGEAVPATDPSMPPFWRVGTDEAFSP